MLQKIIQLIYVGINFIAIMCRWSEIIQSLIITLLLIFRFKVSTVYHNGNSHYTYQKVLQHSLCLFDLYFKLGVA